ncbi:MAG: MmgE/PrpD family protein [Solirubrobacteraceae bacterium]
MPNPPITESIARFVNEAELGASADALFERAVEGFVDTVAVSIAARGEPAVIAATTALERELRSGESTVLATGGRASEAYAALLNGVASHALDLDDVADAIYGHPSAALFPALLAVAESERASGRALLDAYAVGFQVLVAIAAGLPIRPHYSRGWHSTATVGVIGATAGLCRLLELPLLEVRHALGMAASMAAGSRQNFGTMTKPLHPGLAARSAITAARLAQSGFTADGSQLEGELGYFAMFGVDGDLERVLAALNTPWALVEQGLNVKKYPCCYNTHRTADAALALASRVDAGAVDSVRLTMEPGGLDPLIHHRPTTGLEGKFSGEYVVAAGLIDGRVGLDSFSDDAVRRPGVQELLRRVEVVESPDPPFGDESYEFAYATLEVHAGADVQRERVDVPKGDARAPLGRDEIDEKMRDCAAHGGFDGDADALLAELRALPHTERLTGFAQLGGAPALSGGPSVAGCRLRGGDRRRRSQRLPRALRGARGPARRLHARGRRAVPCARGRRAAEGRRRRPDLLARGIRTIGQRPRTAPPALRPRSRGLRADERCGAGGGGRARRHRHGGRRRLHLRQ